MSGRKVAAIQMVSGPDCDANLQEAGRLMAEAAEAGAATVVLPENFAVFSTSQMPAVGRKETSGEGHIQAFLKSKARELGLWIVGGSIPLAHRPNGQEIPDRVRATCLVIDDKGNEAARYDKIHLFDAAVEDEHGRYVESDTFEPGHDLITVETPAGVLGLAICYDLRFPELFRGLRAAGADWTVLPSAFTWNTGNAHWHPLIRARAIENQMWMVAAGQGGWNTKSRRTYGHSMIVDPWGRVVTEREEEGAGWVAAELDPDVTDSVRERMPVWSHRKM